MAWRKRWKLPLALMLANDGSGIFLLARFGVSCRQKTHAGRALACSRQGRLRQGPPRLAASQRSRITPTVILVPVEVGAHVGPRLPHAPQTKRSSTSDNRTSSGQRPRLIATEWLHL